jgi:hypothetical protein
MARRVRRRSVGQRAAALVLTWAVPAASVPAPIAGASEAAAPAYQGGASGAAVRPILECVRQNGRDSFTAFFGYHNEGRSAVTIPARGRNAFAPGGDKRGQPEVFAPGRSPRYPNAAFSVDFDGPLLVWTLRGPDGQTRSASASPSSPRCSDPAPSPSASPAPGGSCELPVFGPKRYTRATGRKVKHEESFTVPASAAGPFTLVVESGDRDGRGRALAWVRVNGELVVRPRDLHAHRGRDRDLDEDDDQEDHRGCGEPVASLRRAVTLAPGSVATLTVTLAATPGSYVTLSICGRQGDTVPPVLSWSEPAPDSFTTDATPRLLARWQDAGSGVGPASFQAFLDDVDVTALFTRGADSASAELPAALADGGHVLRGSVRDRAGLVGESTARFAVDTGAPVVAIEEPAPDSVTAAQTVAVRVRVNDLSPATVVVDGQRAVCDAPADACASGERTYTALDVPIGDLASRTLTAVVTDAAGHATSESVTLGIDRRAPSLAITEPSEAYVKGGVIDVAGEGSDETPVVVEVNGVPATVVPAGTGPDGRGRFTFAASVPAVDGSFRVTAAARDAAGNPQSAFRDLVVDGAAPQIAVAEPAQPFFTNAETALVSGTVSDSSPVTLLVNGLPAACEGTPSCAWSAVVALGSQSAPVDVSARDAAGNESSTTVPITVDRVPPVLTIETPLPDAAVGALPLVVAGVVSDTSPLVVTVNDRPATVTGSAWHVQLDGLLEGSQELRAVARDAAGNQTSSSRNAVVDLGPPVLVVTAPESGLLTSSGGVTVTGSVLDRSDVTVRVRGTAIETLVPRPAVPAAVPFTLGPVPLAEGDNALVIEAVDATQRLFEIPLTVTRDQTAPTLELQAPASVSRGRPGQATVAAADAHFERVAVTLTCVPGSGGAPCAPVTQSFTTPSFHLPLAVPAGAAAGDSLGVTAVAFDRAGNSQAASRMVGIAADGALVGQVLDDATGLPLAGASVELEAVAPGGALPQRDSATSDERGRWSIATAGANAVVLAARDGFTSVERALGVASGSGTVPVDARLQALAKPVEVGADGGPVKPVPPDGAPAGLWSAEVERVTVTIPAGAAGPYRLTPLSGQGLPNLLPLGWSPLLAFDLRAAAPVSVSPQAMVTGLPDVTLHLVRYDFAAHAWRMAAPELRPSDGAVSVVLPAPGAYALIVADPLDPPLPVPPAGAPLEGVAIVAVPQTAASTGAVTPAAIPPSGGTARGNLAVHAPVALPSGTVFQAEVEEQYTLASGAGASEETRSVDIVAYRSPCPAGTASGALCASFPITPSRRGSYSDVASGRVHLDILAGREGVRGTVGGSEPVTLESGAARLFVARGALAEDTAFVLEEQARSAFLPSAAGLTALYELEVDFGGQTLGVPAELSIGGAAAAAAGSAGAGELVFAKVERLAGIPRLAVAALGQLEGERVVSKPYPGLPGIVKGGRYVLYRLGAPVGFVAGVTSSASGPLRAVVEPAADDPGRLPFLALSGVDGRYALAAATGTRPIRATVPGAPFVAAASVAVLPLATTPQDLVLAGAVTTASVNPPDGALGVSTTATIEIASDSPFDPATLVPANFALQRVPASAGEATLNVGFRLVVAASARLVTLVPEALEPSRSYRLSASGLADSVGGLVVVPSVTFRTKDVVAPFYDPRRLVFGMPNADGIVTVTAPRCHPEPGCFYPGTTILIINSGNGAVLSLTAGNDGEIASSLPASLNDTLLVSITDPFGNTTSFQKSEFVDEATGETGVGPGGGTVRSTDGAAELRIPEGALENGVTFKVSVVPESELPDLFPNAEHERILEGGHLGGMVRIEASQDVTFRKEVDLAFPLPDFTRVPESQRPASPNDAFYFIHRRVERCPDGTTTCPPEARVVVFEAIDDARVEGEGANARVVTASFPFSGLLVATATLGVTLMVLGWFLKDAVTLLAPTAAVSGKVLRAKFNQATQAMEYVPVEGALVSGYDLGGEQLINKAGGSYATSQKDGTFALTDPHYSGGEVQIYAMLGDEVARATAFEITGGWAAKFRKGATANITFPEQAPPPPPPLLQIHVRRKSDAKEVGGYAVAGVPLVVSFTSNYDVTGVQIEGQQYPFRRGISDLLTWDLDGDYLPAEVGTVEIVGTARSGDTGAYVTVTRSLRVLAAGGPVDTVPNKPPSVTEVEPKHDEVGVPVSAFLQVFFSEPVKRIRDVASALENVTLAEVDANQVAGPPLAIRISGVRPTGEAVANITSASETVTSLSIEPLLGLKYGQRYRVSVKSGIQDLDKDAQQNPAPKSLLPFSWEFETFGPEGVGGSAEATGSPGIAVIGSRAYLARTNNFANGTLEGYRIDDPVLPAKLREEEFFAPRPYDIVGSGNDDDRLVAIATGSTSYSKPASVLLYDVTSDEDFRWVGAASVASNAYEGFISRLQIFRGSVYTATVRRGIQVVDIAAATAQMDALLARPNPAFELQRARADLNTDGIGFGHEAVVQTLPLPQKPNSTDYYLNDLKVADLAGQTVVVVAGEPGLVVASPAFGTINYNDNPEKVEPVAGGGQRVVRLEWGHALALARLGDRDIAVVVGLGKLDGVAKTLLLAIDLANLAAPSIAGYLDLGPHLDGLQAVDVLVKDDTALVGLQNGARDQGAVLLVSLADITKPIFAGRLVGQDGSPLGGRLALTDTGLLLTTAKAALGGATPLGGIRTAAFDTVGAILPVNPTLAKFVPGSNLEREQTLKDIPLQMRTYPKSQKVPELLLELFEDGALLEAQAFALSNNAVDHTLPKGLVKDVKKEITARVSFSHKGRSVVSAPRLLPITGIRLTLDSNNDTIVEDKDDEDVLQDPNANDPEKALRLTFWEADARFDPKPTLVAGSGMTEPAPVEYWPIFGDFALLRLQLRAPLANDERIGVLLQDSRLELVEKADPVVGAPSSCLGDPREYKGKEHLCHGETANKQAVLFTSISTRPKPAAATPGGVVEIPTALFKKGDNFFLFRCKGQGGDTAACPGTRLEVVRLTDQAPETIDSRRVELLPFKKLAGMVSLRRTGNPDSEDPMDPSYRVAPEARPIAGWAEIPTDIDDLTLYVHGYNVTEGEFTGRTARGWFGTAIKRLYWAGHRVLATKRAFAVGVSWPGDIPGDILTLKRLPYYAEDEFNALQAGLPLGGLIKDLRERPGLTRLNILAHSLGNMVVNNALKEVPTDTGAAVNYVMNQAAISSEAFLTVYNPLVGVRNKVPGILNVVQHAWDLGFPNPDQGVVDPDLRWTTDEGTIEKTRQTNGCLTGPATYSPSSQSAECLQYTSSGLQLPKQCKCDDVTRYFSLRYQVNPEIDPTLQEPATTASTPFFTSRWGKLARNNDANQSLKGAWTQFFFTQIDPGRTPDGIRVFNTFNTNDAVLRIDAGPGGLDAASNTVQFHVWRVGQIKGKPFKSISSTGGFLLGAVALDADDPLDEQKWWTLELPGRPSWWRSTAEDHVIEQQRSVWNGRAPDGTTLPEEERLKAIARRTRLWAELSIWYPALSASAGAVSLSDLNGDMTGVDLLALPRQGRNIDFTGIGGGGGLDIADGSNLSHSYMTVLPLHEVWRGYRVIRNIFKATLP